MEEQQTAKGYLVVQVTTANSAIPLVGAGVTISGESEENANAIYELKTGAGGRTERVALSTVPRAESESPGIDRPYTTYRITVTAPDYETAIYQGVAIFEGITAFQQANLTPISENGSSDSFTLDHPNVYQNIPNDL